MKIAIIGASGFIGAHLFAHVRRRYPDAIGTAARLRDDRLHRFDLKRPDIRPLRLRETGHEAVVLAAGETAIAACEDNEDAYQVNVRGTIDLIEQIAREQLPVIFLSSDQVFDGRDGDYCEESVPAPPMAYGRHKREVERRLQDASSEAVIVRLSKTFGLRKNDGTLLDEMASRLADGQQLREATDLQFNPTWVGDVASGILALAEARLQGIVHLACPEQTSRYELAVRLAERMGVDTRRVRPIEYAELGDPRRPRNTTLRCDRISSALKMRFRPLDDCLDQVAYNWRQT